MHSRRQLHSSSVVTVLCDYQQWLELPAEGFANGRRKGIKYSAKNKSQGSGQPSLMTVLRIDRSVLGGQSESSWN